MDSMVKECQRSKNILGDEHLNMIRSFQYVTLSIYVKGRPWSNYNQLHGCHWQPATLLAPLALSLRFEVNDIE